MSNPLEDGHVKEKIKRLLTNTRVVRNACDLDLLVFLHRHPHCILTSEQVATFVGYNSKQIAEALDALIEAGVLDRTSQQSTHAARMFLLHFGSQQGGEFRELLELASTRLGRQRILEAFNGSNQGRKAGHAPDLRLFKAA